MCLDMLTKCHKRISEGLNNELKEFFEPVQNFLITDMMLVS